MSQRARVRAPALVGRGGWLNTDGPLGLEDFAGRFVLLDFWTFCCINCLHVIEELREVEARFADVLTVVGVHSPKFPHEADHEAVADAVTRHGITHPVLDDPELLTWRAYAARAWPTLVLIDPTGRIIWTAAGEGHAHALAAQLEVGIAEHEAAGTLRRGVGGSGPIDGSRPPARDRLRFPAKAVRLPDGRLLVADAGSHRLAILDRASGSGSGSGFDVAGWVGSGTRGRRDGFGDRARFHGPNGLCVLPSEVAEAIGSDVVVADTVNGALRGVRLDGQAATVSTLAEGIRSPWDVAWWRGRVWVAVAGTHQLGVLEVAGEATAFSVVGGTGVEGLRDGPLEEAWFAQPSGLAAAGQQLWVADAETSAVRVVEPVPAGAGAPSVPPAARGLRVRTVIGQGLFDFGHRDGDGQQALLQHPLGIAVLAAGAGEVPSVLVADTYNGAVRRFEGGRVLTVASDLAEPSGFVVSSAGGGQAEEVLVVESTAHRLTPLVPEAREIIGMATRLARPPTDLAPGAVELVVDFTPPPGQELDERYGPATRLSVTATPPALLLAGQGRSESLRRTISLDAAVAEGVLHVSASAASCADGGVCHLHQQDWGIPVRVRVDGASTLPIALAAAS